MNWFRPRNQFDDDIGKIMICLSGFSCRQYNYNMFLNFRNLLIVSNNNLFRTLEKITDEKKTDEDWGMIMDFCDRVQATKDGPRDCLKSIMKQLNHTNPHVQLKAITVMNINQCFLKPTKHLKPTYHHNQNFLLLFLATRCCSEQLWKAFPP